MRSMPICILIICVICGYGCPGIPPKEDFPKNDNFHLAEKSFLSGDYATAINSYTTFLAADPHSPYKADAEYRIGLSHFALDNHEMALKWFNQALDGARYSWLKARILNSIAYLFLTQQDYQKAIKYYEDALKEDKSRLPLPDVYYNLGVILMRVNKWHQGKQYLQSALAECLKLKQKNSTGRLAESINERLSLPPDTFVVQLGKFADKDNAAEYQAELIREKGLTSSVNIIALDGRELYYVWAGSFPDYEQARTRVDEIRAMGLEAVILP
ncbi:MAG: tetratricopeptide repeat protein [Planctomycetes bacterium]|nr:tetratricopeptide repeat protein [Planctomycetota bacterium]